MSVIPKYPITVNTPIGDTIRDSYKYVVLYETLNHKDEKAYSLYALTNDLYSASLRLREINNGVILEMSNVIGK